MTKPAPQVNPVGWAIFIVIGLCRHVSIDLNDGIMFCFIFF